MSLERDTSLESLSKRGKIHRGTTVDSKALITSDKYKSKNDNIG